MDYPYITLSEAQKLNYVVQNALIAEIDLNLIGHFGDIVTLEIRLSDGRVFFQPLQRDGKNRRGASMPVRPVGTV